MNNSEQLENTESTANGFTQVSGCLAFFALSGMLHIGFIIAFFIQRWLSPLIKSYSHAAIPVWIITTLDVVLALVLAALWYVVMVKVESRSKRIGEFLYELTALFGLLAPIILAVGMPIVEHFSHHQIHHSKP